MDLRKNLIIIISLLSAVTLILLFLNLNKSWKKQPARIVEGQINVPADSPKNNSPKKVSRGSVRFFDLIGPDKIIFYDEYDSTIYEASPDGRDKKEIVRIPGAFEIIFGPSGKNLIAATSTNQGVGKFYFDLENNKRVELSQGIGSAAFSPSGSQIAYHFYDENSGEGSISISHPDGSSFKIILKTRIKDLEVFWPEPDSIVFYSKNDSELVFSLSPETGELERLTDSFTNPKFFTEKSGPLGNYTIFISPEDKKLYSLLK